MGACRYQVLCIPLKRRETVNKRELDNQCFHQYNKQTKVFDKVRVRKSSCKPLINIPVILNSQ